MDKINPKLVEPISKYYTNLNLKEVRKFKDKWYNLAINIILFLGFLAFFGIFLICRFKGKLSDEELIEKRNREKIFLFEKMHKYQYEKAKDNNNLITDLPII